MTIGTLLCLIMIITGVIILILILLSLARRKLTESFCLAWGLFAVLLILAGCLLHPSELNHYISIKGLVLLLFALYGIIVGLYALSLVVSTLMRRNRELAMRVSLLNQENEQIMRKLNQLEQKKERGVEKEQ